MKHINISEKPPQIKAHFLRRNLNLFPEDELVLKKIRMKGLSLRYISEIDNPQDEEEENNIVFDLKKHKYFKGKNIKGLHKAEFSCFSSLQWLNNIKNAKSLRDVSIEIGREDLNKITGFLDIHAKVKHIIQCLKKFPKNIVKIKLCIEGLSVKKKDMNQIYRALASLKNLESCSRLFGFAELEGYVQEDYRLIKRYMPLLPKLKEFDYDYWRYDKSSWDDDQVLNIVNYTSADQVDFQKLVKNIEPCPWITAIGINIVGEFLQTFPTYGREFEVEESEDEDNKKVEDEEEEKEEEKKQEEDEEEEKEFDIEMQKELGIEDEEDEESTFSKFYKGEAENNNENNGNEEEKAEEEKAQKVREEIMPFYQFHRFTNLKKLDFQIFPDCLYTLEPFVVEAFASLKNLEHLEVTLEARPMGTGYIFEGIVQLPLLKSFKLETIFLSNDDWELLKEFLKKQEDLESLSLEISKKRRTKARYDAQNKQFKELFKCLDGKLKLQYLSIGSDFCSIETLSEGLKELTMSHQFKLLQLQGMDDISTSNKNAAQRIEGLCDFLNRQRGSLLYLKLYLPFVVDSEIMEHLTIAISELEELKELELLVNNIFKAQRQAYVGFFEKTMLKDNPVRTCKNKKCYYRNISTMLGKLKKLDDLTLYFGANSDNQKFGEDFIELLSALPKIRLLRNVDINVPFFNVSTWMLQRMKVFFEKMKDISGLIVDTDDVEDDEACDAIEEIVEKVNKRQYLRCDIMF